MPHDIDVCLYSLRKWARLAMKGNPSVLHFLFAEPMFNTIPWARVFYQRDIFLAKSHIGQFLGYANAQLAKLLGQRGGKDCRRRALEEKHSYDTKYAMHLIRLYGEALELFTDGKITFPRPEKDFLIGIRAGAYTLSQIRELANDLESQVHAAKDKSPLPDTIDRVKVSNFISNIYMNFWEDGIPVGSWHYEEKTR
jgi:predicted nucleotidyltransferase